MADTAPVVGVGPTLGDTVAHRFAAAGVGVGLLARSERPEDAWTHDLAVRARGGEVRG